MNERIRRILPWLCVIGIGIAGYLSYVKLTNTEAVCGGLGDCGTVQNSIYAYVYGIPVAYLGLLTYVTLLALALIARRVGPDRRSWVDLGFFVVAFIGTLFSAYLTYTEIFILRTYCPWCLASFALLIAIAILSALVVFGANDEPDF